MRVIVFSDVQANEPAMEAMIEEIDDWNPDFVVMDGDLVNRGPSSLACLDLCQSLADSRACHPLRGNHEDFVLYCKTHAPSSAGEADIRAFTDWTVMQLGERSEDFRPWPDHFCFHAPQQQAHWVHVTHGTMRDNRHGVRRETSDQELGESIPAGLDLFITAHTHRPLERVVAKTRVVNIGSAGSPFDGDTRGSYARLVWRNDHWKTTIERFDYDRERAARNFFDSGFYDEGGPLARLIYEEWYRAKSLIPFWHQQYRDAVLRGDISADAAVDAFLSQL
jgi:predicted phosphodiesterase